MASQEPIDIETEDADQMAASGAAQPSKKRKTLYDVAASLNGPGRVVQMSNCKVIVRKVVVPVKRPSESTHGILGQIRLDDEPERSTAEKAQRIAQRRQERLAQAQKPPPQPTPEVAAAAEPKPNPVAKEQAPKEAIEKAAAEQAAMEADKAAAEKAAAEAAEKAAAEQAAADAATAAEEAAKATKGQDESSAPPAPQAETLVSDVSAVEENAVAPPVQDESSAPPPPQTEKQVSDVSDDVAAAKEKAAAPSVEDESSAPPPPQAEKLVSDEVAAVREKAAAASVDLAEKATSQPSSEAGNKDPPQPTPAVAEAVEHRPRPAGYRHSTTAAEKDKAHSEQRNATTPLDPLWKLILEEPKEGPQSTEPSSVTTQQRVENASSKEAGNESSDEN